MPTVRRTYDVAGVTHDHYVFTGGHAPTDDAEDHVYRQLTRVRDWDANERAGFKPCGNGRKRMIEPLDAHAG